MYIFSSIHAFYRPIGTQEEMWSILRIPLHFNCNLLVRNLSQVFHFFRSCCSHFYYMWSYHILIIHVSIWSLVYSAGMTCQPGTYILEWHQKSQWRCICPRINESRMCGKKTVLSGSLRWYQICRTSKTTSQYNRLPYHHPDCSQHYFEVHVELLEPVTFVVR